MEIKKDPIKKRNSESKFRYSAWVKALYLLSNLKTDTLVLKVSVWLVFHYLEVLGALRRGYINDVYPRC